MKISDIQDLIDEEINPVLESHGGFISIKELDESNKILKLIMGGGCQGCASSKTTMINGVRGHIMEAFPEIIEIEDVTDHIAGENPYYANGDTDGNNNN